MNASRRFVTSGAIELAVYTWGQPGAGRPAVLLVHGYPDSAQVWEQVARLLATEHYVIAYDVRGAGYSGKPDSTAGYGLGHLIGDMAAVIDALSPQQPVHLVGHDWGALQGWEAVVSPRLQGRIASWTAAAPGLDHVGLWFRKELAAGTGAGYRAALGQMLGSWYMLAFQLPLLPELSWRLGLDRLWPTLLNTLEGITTEAPSPTRRADGIHGIGLYRANLLPRLLRPQAQPTSVPTQLLVMQQDRFVPARLFDGLQRFAPGLRRREISAGHWAPLSRPQEWAGHIADFVADHHALPQTPANTAT